MDIEGYISSGILDAYVLGAATPEETAEVEALMAEHPEIAAEVEALQATMEGFADLHSVPPPPEIRGNILEQIRGADTGVGSDTNTGADTPPPSEIPVRSLPSSGRRWQWIAAAASVLLVASLIFNFVQRGQLQEAQSELATSGQENAGLLVDLDSCSGAWQDLNQKIEDRKNATLVARLESQVKNETFDMVVQRNPKSGNMYLAETSLPPATGETHYQYWTLDSTFKPTDMGDIDIEDPELIFEPIGTAPDDAVYAAVTLETGPHKKEPDLTQLKVLGTL